jgi:hypothetical protein
MEPAMSKYNTEKLLTDILSNCATIEVAAVRARWIAEGYWVQGSKTLTDRGRAVLLWPKAEPRRRCTPEAN